MSWTKNEVIVLINICLFFVCAYASINVPAPFEHDIIQVFNIDVYRYGVISSLSSWASLLDVGHGYLLDRYLSLSLATLIYTGLVVVGTIIYCASSFTRLYWMIVLGRGIFGLGCNPLMLLCNKHIIIWFGKGQHVTFVYSLVESILWLGSTIVFYTTSHIMSAFKQHYSENTSYALTSTLELGLFCLLTVLPMLITSFMNRYVEKSEADQSEGNANDVKKKRTFSDHVCLPFIFWMFALTVFVFYVTFMSFLSMSLLFFVWKYDVSPSQASTLSGTITLAAAIISPIFGTIMDRIGHNLTSFTVAVLVSCLSQCLIAFTDITPYVPVLLMSLSLGLASGIWSQFQFLVEEHQHMIAYGVAQTGVNGAQAIGTIVAGSIISYYGNQGFIYYLFACILCALPLIGGIWYLDRRRGFFINLTPHEKHAALARAKQKKREEELNDVKGNVNEGFDTRESIVI